MWINIGIKIKVNISFNFFESDLSITISSIAPIISGSILSNTRYCSVIIGIKPTKKRKNLSVFIKEVKKKVHIKVIMRMDNLKLNVFIKETYKKVRLNNIMRMANFKLSAFIKEACKKVRVKNFMRVEN